MARLRVATRWERVIVPAFVYFFGKLFPFRRVNRHKARTAAAAGGCVLVRRTSLAAAGGIDAIRDAVIDDVSLGTLVKRGGGRIRLVLADPRAGTRPSGGRRTSTASARIPGSPTCGGWSRAARSPNCGTPGCC